MGVNTSVNLNLRNKYISYTSPFMKTKKGNALQRTKGISKYKKVNNELDMDRIHKIIDDMQEILSSFDVFSRDYESYIIAKSRYDEDAVKFIYEGSEFENKYNQDLISKSMDKVISIYNDKGDFCLPAIVMAGEPGSGKTTLLKQLIGSVYSNFPATSQSNTTVGQLYIKNLANANELKCCARLFSLPDLEERIKNKVIEIIKLLLRKNNLDMKEIREHIYDRLITSNDRKCKLEYIVDADDVVKYIDVKGLDEYPVIIWHGFLNSELNDMGVTDDFNNIIDASVISKFEMYLEELIINANDFTEINRVQTLYNEILYMIKKKTDFITRRLIKDTFAGDMSLFSFTQKVEITILDENNMYTLNKEKLNDDTIAWENLQEPIFPRMISIRIYGGMEYNENFFLILELLSSADKSKKSLFPLIDELRAEGMFVPRWDKNGDNHEDYIIVDTEGIGHDMRMGDISISLRKLLDKCDLILYSQNASIQLTDKFANSIITLIHTAAIGKTSFIFNRMEKFARNYDESEKILFVISGIENSLSKIARDEEDSMQKIVSGREGVYTDLIKFQSLFFEYLDERFVDEEKVVLEEHRDIYDTLTDQLRYITNKEQRLAIEKAQNAFEKKFYDFSNPIRNLKKIFNKIAHISDAKDPTRITKIMKPYYRADSLTNTLNAIVDKFLYEFFYHINNDAWQTVKAFNNRIANDFDYHEWKNIKPESELVGLLQGYLMSYLLNPDNLDDLDNKELMTYINWMFDKKVNKELFKCVELMIFEELRAQCWIPAFYEVEGAGSTSKRSQMIINKVKQQFTDTQNGNVLYRKIMQILFNNEFMKDIKAEYI